MAIDRVLIVDDSAVQRAAITQLCRELGVAEVLTAVHGAHALEQLAALPAPPDAMIIDLEMPVMDGVELIEQMRERALRIPFALASTREPALLETVAAMARAHGFVQATALRKPVSAPALHDALARCTAPRAPAPAPAAAAAPIDPARLLRAIADRTIVPHYQPKVDSRTGMIRGVEALARWPDPALGNPTPDRFVAAADAEGLIHPLTMSILDQAFAQTARWNARGLALSIAVNLAPRLLESSALVGEITTLAERHRLAADQVVLELTETSLVASQGPALGVLARLRMKGFRLSIDDYGTGFSSMQQLARAPFTELKIDRSFVDGASRHEHRRAILQSAVETAARLGIHSIAEGVETIEDWRLLQSFGCSAGQGFLFGRAMDGAELPRWLRRHAEKLPLLRAEGGP